MPLNKIPNHIIALKVHLFKTNITWRKKIKGSKIRPMPGSKCLEKKNRIERKTRYRHKEKKTDYHTEQWTEIWTNKLTGSRMHWLRMPDTHAALRQLVAGKGRIRSWDRMPDRHQTDTNRQDGKTKPYKLDISTHHAKNAKSCSWYTFPSHFRNQQGQMAANHDAYTNRDIDKKTFILYIYQ